MGSRVQIVVRPAARRDLLDHYDYLSFEAGAAMAVRFLAAVESATQMLAARPGIGRLCGFSGRISSRFRQWPVPGFENWPIFYIPYPNKVDIVRVLHGARDLASILE